MNYSYMFYTIGYRSQVWHSRWYTTYLRPRKFRVFINEHYSSEKNNAFQCTPRINIGYLSVHCICTHHHRSDTKLTSTQCLCGWPLNKKIIQPRHHSRTHQQQHTDDETGTIAIIEDTMLKVKTWMDAVHIKLNESKTEFIYFGSRQQLRKCQNKTINISGTMSYK